MWTQKVVRYALLLLLASITIGLCVYYGYLHVKDRQFRTQLQTELYQLGHSTVEQSASLLTTLANETTSCDAETIERLQEKEFYEANLRVVGWIDEQQQLCTSRPGLSQTLFHFPLQTHRYPYAPTIDLLVVNRAAQPQKIIVLLEKYKKKWFATLEPWWFNVSQTQCPACTTITIGEKATETESHFFLGTLPVAITYHTSLIRAQHQPMAMLFAGVGTLFTSLLLVGVCLWRQWQATSPQQCLKAAIQRQDIIPYYQLIQDSQVGKATHCEVLARWTQGNLTMPPNEFIPLAESSGLIDELLESLITQTLAMAQAHPTLCHSVVFSFNVSPSQLERPAFVERLIALSRLAQPLQLALEITEREPFHSLKYAKNVIEQLKSEGLLIELDDAGTGYGSFSYVKELGFDILKIDKMFIDTIQCEPLKKKVLDGLIEFGHTTELTMIAEGVEHQEQANYLNDKGVFLHQGFLYCRPLNQGDFIHRLQDESSASGDLMQS